MFPYRNPLVEREKRMAEGRRTRRINGTRNQVRSAILWTVAGEQLSFRQRFYADYLCGLRPADVSELTPEEKAYIGNLFEQACRARRSAIMRHPRHEQVEALPGIMAVPRNRELVRQRQSEAGRRKRKSLV